MCSVRQGAAAAASTATATAAPAISFSSSTAVQYDDDDDVITDVLQDEVCTTILRPVVFNIDCTIG